MELIQPTDKPRSDGPRHHRPVYRAGPAATALVDGVLAMKNKILFGAVMILAFGTPMAAWLIGFTDSFQVAVATRFWCNTVVERQATATGISVA
jgi:hypothetical protein